MFSSLRTLCHSISVSTHIYGAAHQWAPLQCLLHDLVKLFGCLGQLEELGNSSCEILHGFQSVPAFQCLVRPVQPEREVSHFSRCADTHVLQRLLVFLRGLHSKLKSETWGWNVSCTTHCVATVQKKRCILIRSKKIMRQRLFEKCWSGEVRGQWFQLSVMILKQVASCWVPVTYSVSHDVKAIFIKNIWNYYMSPGFSSFNQDYSLNSTYFA